MSTLARLLVASAAITATGIFAWVEMFSQFQYYDDEGTLMVSVKTFLDGRPLYDQTFTPYGPFYFLVAKLLYGVAGLSVSHDVTRLTTIGLWLATAVLAAALVYRLTSSFGWALVAYLQTVVHCRTLINEPGHPQAILVALAMSLPLIVALRAPRIGSAALMGAVAACILLTKINLGVYTLIALLIVYCALTASTLVIRSGLLVLSVIATVIPFAVMRDADWAENYSKIAALSAAASCLTIWFAKVQSRLNVSHLGIFVAAVAGTTAAILAAILIAGTSIDGLIDGLVLTPLRLPTAYSVPWRLPSYGVTAGWISLAGALVALLASRSQRTLVAVLLKVFFGVLAVVAMTRSRDAMVSVAPLAWVILLPHSPEPWRVEALFPRAIVCLLVSSHLLIAYPVAGSQQSWATLLLIPAAIVSLGDAGSVLASRLNPAVRRVAAPVLFALVVLVYYYPRFEPTQWLRRYQALVPLGLPGADRIRLREEEVRLYRDVVAGIAERCDTFTSMPQFNSFYFWTRQDPPNGFNDSAWMTLFDARMQQQIVDRLAAADSPCVIHNAIAAEERVQGRNVDGGPLVQYIRTSFHTVEMIGDFEVMVRK